MLTRDPRRCQTAVSVTVLETAPAASDFNGDGKSDIFWRNSVTGENYLSPMW